MAECEGFDSCKEGRVVANPKFRRLESVSFQVRNNMCGYRRLFQNVSQADGFCRAALYLTNEPGIKKNNLKFPIYAS